MLKQSPPFFKVYSQLFIIHVQVDNLLCIISLYIHCLWLNYQPAFLFLLKVFKLYILFVSLSLCLLFQRSPSPRHQLCWRAVTRTTYRAPTTNLATPPYLCTSPATKTRVCQLLWIQSCWSNQVEYKQPDGSIIHHICHSRTQ